MRYNVLLALGIFTIILQHYDTSSSAPCERDWYPQTCIPTQHVPLWVIPGDTKEICSKPCSSRRKHMPALWALSQIDFASHILAICADQSTTWCVTTCGMGSCCTWAYTFCEGCKAEDTRGGGGVCSCSGGGAGACCWNSITDYCCWVASPSLHVHHLCHGVHHRPDGPWIVLLA